MPDLSEGGSDCITNAVNVGVAERFRESLRSLCTFSFLIAAFLDLSDLIDFFDRLLFFDLTE
jgi:hypothetical protein